MKFAVSFISGAAALQIAKPTVNMVLTNDAANANAFSFAQSQSKAIKTDLAELVKHPILMEGDFNQPNVIRINYDQGHGMLMENIVRESVDSGAAYEDGEIGLNLIPAGAASAASLKQLMAKTDADFEAEFRAGLHASFLEAPATRIRLPRGGLKEGESLISEDGRIAIRVLPARHIPGGFTQIASKIEKSGEESEAAVAQLLSLFAEGKISKQQMKDSGALSRCADVMKSESSSDAMKGSCGSVITHLTNIPVASSVMDPTTGGSGHVTVVLPSPSRVYGA